MPVAAWTITITRGDITFWIAIFGLLLGVTNLLVSYFRGKVSLTVKPMFYGPCEGGFLCWEYPDKEFNQKRLDPVVPTKLCIEIQNNGYVAATVGEVGFLGQGKKGMRFVITRPLLPDGGEWPRRLDPMSSFTAYTIEPATKVYGDFQGVFRAYVKVAGRSFFGENKRLAKTMQDPGFVRSNR